MLEYNILRGANAEEMSNFINKAVRDGWTIGKLELSLGNGLSAYVMLVSKPIRVPE